MRFHPAVAGVVAIVGATGAYVRAETPPSSPAKPPAVTDLTLEKALTLAATRNERAAIADLDVVVAEAGVVKARAAFLPALNFNAKDTIAPFDSGPVNDVSAQLTVNQPLFVPAAHPLYSAAKHNLAEARADAIDDKRTLAFDTAKAYFQAYLAEQVLLAAQKKLETAKADLADTDAQFRAQLVSSNDVTRAKVSLGSAQRELAQDNGNLDTAYVQLEFLINADVAPHLAAPTAFLAASEVMPGNPDDLVTESLKRRPDLAGRREAALAAHDAAREPHMRFYPTLAAQATGQFDNNGTRSGHDFDASAAIVLQWSIYDAGTRSADEKSRGAQAAIADLDVVALERQIEAQIHSASAALVSAQAALQSAKEAAEAAQKSAEETSILYKQGLAKAIELVDANEQRFAAEVNYASAEVTVATAYLSLRQAMGLAPVGTETK